MSFERKTVEPERSPIDSPCQNVEKSSNDGTPKLVPSRTTGLFGAAQGVDGCDMQGRRSWCLRWPQVLLA